MTDLIQTIRRQYRDPRLYQITVLTTLLAYGFLVLKFDASIMRAAVFVVSALAAQFICTRAFRLPRFDFRSPLISSLSLCLLLRTASLELAAAAAFITIAGKFVIRRRGKHVFNPTNFGITVALLATNQAWISPGQWGSLAWLAVFFACLGGLVVNRAERSDVTWAFLIFYAVIVFGRSVWLNEPLAIPFHRLQNGAFLLFTFFMISDPKTTPDRRVGRVLFAAIVAAAAGVLRFSFHEPNGLMYALFFSAPLVPVIDRFLRGEQYVWGATHTSRPVLNPSPVYLRPFRPRRSRHMRRWTPLIIVLLAMTFITQPVLAFCGFYVARADADLFNEASQVVLVRHDNKTVITMANDYQGDPSEFALVIPVPTFIERGQIHVASMSLIDHLDAYTAPRLVEYFDDNPCHVYKALRESAARMAQDAEAPMMGNSALGVSIEATYTVGEYDIVILSAEQSGGLETWLADNGYRIPKGAARVLESYIKQKMRFFVAKVNLDEQARLGYSMLRPIQVAFESPKFMLPIRLGTVNAKGPQDLLVYALTQNGRVETTNYRTVNLPSNLNVPVFVKDEFSDFYLDMFDHQVQEEGMRTVFTEYAWNMSWCDPCAADPLSRDELRELGVFWLDGYDGQGNRPQVQQVRPQQVYVTRLHVRYDARHFPDDLVFQETGDTSNFQGRYVLRHPWTGSDECDQVRQYRRDLLQRQEQEARNLVDLTGWDLAAIRHRMGLDDRLDPERKWWQKIWGGKG